MTNLAGWQATLQSDTGDVISGGSVEVRSTATGTPLASIFDDEEGNTALSNPFNVGTDGFAQFFVATGQYTIAATFGGGTTTWTEDLVAAADVAAIETDVEALQDADASAATRVFANAAAVAADTGLTYTAGQNGTVTAGVTFSTTSEAFAYEVAASGAADHHLATAGGVKLYALPDADGAVYTSQIGLSDGDDAGDTLRAFVAARQTGIDYITQDTDLEFSGATVTLPTTLRGYIAADYDGLSHGEAASTTLAMRDREAVVAAEEGIPTEADAVFTVPSDCLIGGIRFDHSQPVAPLEMRNGGSFIVLSTATDASSVRVDKCAFVQEGGICLDVNSGPYWQMTNVHFDTARTGVSVDTGCDYGVFTNNRGTIGLETLRASGSNTQKFGDWIKTNRGTIDGPKYCQVIGNHMVNPVRDGVDGTGGLRGWVFEKNIFECSITALDIKQSYDAANSENERERYYQAIVIRDNHFIGCGIVWTLSWVDANLGFAYDERLGVQANVCDGNTYWGAHGKSTQRQRCGPDRVQQRKVAVDLGLQDCRLGCQHGQLPVRVHRAELLRGHDRRHGGRRDVHDRRYCLCAGGRRLNHDLRGQLGEQRDKRSLGRVSTRSGRQRRFPAGGVGGLHFRQTGLGYAGGQQHRAYDRRIDQRLRNEIGRAVGHTDDRHD